MDIKLKKAFLTVDPVTFQPLLNLDLAFPMEAMNPNADENEEENARQLGFAMIELMKENMENVETDVNKNMGP